MRFFVITIMLTYVWVWLFRKLVFDKPPNYEDDFRDPNVIDISDQQPISSLLTLEERPIHPADNFVVLIWFGTFTYLISEVWLIWLRAILNINPPVVFDDNM